MSEDVFRWVIAVGVTLACVAFVAQTIIWMAFYRFAKGTQDRFGPLTERMEKILDSSAVLVNDIRPRIETLSTEITEIVKNAKVNLDQVGHLVKETTERAQSRIAQIDDTVDHTIEKVETATEAVKETMLRPVREVNGLVNGVKAAVGAYNRGVRRHSVEHATQDEEMFI